MAKTVLVTGATGFIGRHVVRRLLKEKVKVIATALKPDLTLPTTREDDLEFIPFDIMETDPSADLFDLFHRPDMAIHLAWSGLPNYKSDFHLETNLPVQFGFLDNLIRNGLGDLTVAGTCYEYGMQEGLLSESAPAMPANAYARAKDLLRQRLMESRSGEHYVLKWVRLFYLYGEGQNPNSLLPQLESAINRGDKIFNMSPGDQLRDYLPVERAADYMVRIAMQKRVSGIINCCSGSPITVRSLVEQYLGEKDSEITLNLGYYPYPDFEPKDFWGDNTKLLSILNETESPG